VFQLGTEVLLLGRSRATDSALLDPHVSRVHCQIMPEGSRHVLVDFDSAGGTFVNGKQVTRHELRTGDLVRIGTTHLQFVEEQAAADRTAAMAAPVPLAAPVTAGATVTGRVTKVKPGAGEPQRPGAWAEALAGQVFTHYKLGRPLARSHTGYVFHANDTRRNLPLALKVLDPRYTEDEKLVKKFVSAMKAVMPLRHANLIRVYSAGRSSDYLWVAMEYVKAGESLAAVIGRSAQVGRADWRVVLRLGAHLARALDYAHQKKIVHQNVTPQNIILGRQLHETKLADLMLASALHEDPAKPISAAGTPSEALAYMSPERTDGPEADVDARTDIYSLAATLYAVLTGRPPFQADTTTELIAKIRLDGVAPLPEGSAAPAELWALLRRALAKRRKDRQPTAKQFLKELERIAGAHNVALGPSEAAHAAQA
jgi:serine/threonine-protein kinase